MLFVINIIFTTIFVVEGVLKMVGLGMKVFVKDKFNLFDAIVIVLSIVEIGLSDGNEGGGLSALRAFRLFRIFKIFRQGDLRVLIDSIAFTVTSIGNYSVLLLLFIYVYSLMGM